MHERVLRRTGGVEGAVGVHSDVGVQRGILLLDAVEGGPNDFDGGQRTRGDQTRQLSCRRVQGNRHQGQSTVPSAACRVPGAVPCAQCLGAGPGRLESEVSSL